MWDSLLLPSTFKRSVTQVSPGSVAQRQVRTQTLGFKLKLVSSLLMTLIALLIGRAVRPHASFLPLARPPRPRTEVAFCHVERCRGAWPVSVSLVGRAVELGFKNLGFLGFFKKPKKPKNPNLGFLGFLILLFYFNSF